MKKYLLFVASMMIVIAASSQSTLFEPVEIRNAYDKETRSRNGLPGPDYWQNYASYDLKASLNPETKMLKGTGTITYYNNSPDTLRYLILKLLPNIHKKGVARDYAVGADHLNDGMVIDSLSIDNISLLCRI